MATQHSDDLSAPDHEAAPDHERRDADPASREPHESRATGSGRRESSAESAEHDDNRAAGAEQRDTRAGERRAGHVPAGTATDSPPLEGSSLDAPPVQGTYRPDVGPGGRDVDESDQVLTNRSRTARGPDQPSEPVGRSRSGLDEVPPNPSALPRS